MAEMTPREEAAFELYAGGPWGEFVCFQDGGATAVTNAHDPAVYEQMVEAVAPILLADYRLLLSAIKQHRNATESRLRLLDSRGEAARCMLKPDRDLYEVLDRLLDRLGG